MPEQNEFVTFTACEYLDFADNYTAKKNLISLGGTTKVCWNRYGYDPMLVQFCKLRGRLNSPEACHCERLKMCSDYKEFEHKVPLMSIDLS